MLNIRKTTFFQDKLFDLAEPDEKPPEPSEEVGKQVKGSEKTNTFVPKKILKYEIPKNLLDDRNISTVISSKQIRLNPEDMIQTQIKHFVSSFLHPYITGEITKENEPKNRKSMMDLLLETICNVESVPQNEIEEMAFNAYFEQVALGLYVNRVLNKRFEFVNLMLDIDSEEKPLLRQFTMIRLMKLGNELNSNIGANSPEFNKLVAALKESLPKDFLGKNLSNEELIKKASKALHYVNKKREQSKIEAKNHDVTGDVNKKEEKVYELTRQIQSGYLFLKSAYVPTLPDFQHSFPFTLN